MKPGDIIKIKLGGDIQEAKVVDCRNKKTVWVEVLWAKARIHALTPAEKKKKVAASPLSLKGLNEQERALALLARRGKKLVHQSGTKRIKIPRARIVDAEPFEPQPKKTKETRGLGPLEALESPPLKEIVKQPPSQEPMDYVTEEEMQSLPPEKPLSKLAQMKARIAAKKGGNC